MWKGFKFLKFGYFQKFYAASIQFGLVFKRSMFFCSFLNEFDCIFNYKFCSELLETNFLSGVKSFIYYQVLSFEVQADIFTSLESI